MVGQSDNKVPSIMMQNILQYHLNLVKNDYTEYNEVRLQKILKDKEVKSQQEQAITQTQNAGQSIIIMEIT